VTRRQRRTCIALCAAGVAVLIGNAVLAGFHMDFFWFRALGFALFGAGVTLALTLRSRPPS